MHNHKCPLCHKNPTEQVMLRCSHILCYSCAHSLLTVEQASTIETKYKIICPSCSQKTVLFDLRHLIRTHQNDQMFFVSDKYLSSKPQPRVQQQAIHYQGNYMSQQQSQPLSKRGSINSIANKPIVDVKCLQHDQPCRYYCCDCGESQIMNCLLCSQCSKNSLHSSHRVISLRQAQNKLGALNNRIRENLLSKEGDLSYSINYLSHNKLVLEDYYNKLEENLASQFKNIFNTLQDRYSQLKNHLKQMQEQNVKELNGRINKWKNQQQILLSLNQIQLKDIQTQAKFYQTSHKVTSSTQFPTKQDIQLMQLPNLTKNMEIIKQLQEIVVLKVPQINPTPPMSRHASRKPSIDYDQYSHRSNKDKENYKGAFSPGRIPARKIAC